MLSASANKLSKLKEQAEEYASLIMEELDPENLGYIEVKPFQLAIMALFFLKDKNVSTFYRCYLIINKFTQKAAWPKH